MIEEEKIYEAGAVDWLPSLRPRVRPFKAGKAGASPVDPPRVYFGGLSLGETTRVYR